MLVKTLVIFGVAAAIFVGMFLWGKTMDGKDGGAKDGTAK